MPEMDGPEVATQITKLVDQFKIGKPYICCCTAYTSASYKRKALASGMDNFLIKPIDDSSLCKVLTYLKD